MIAVNTEAAGNDAVSTSVNRILQIGNGTGTTFTFDSDSASFGFTPPSRSFGPRTVLLSDGPTFRLVGRGSRQPGRARRPAGQRS